MTQTQEQDAILRLLRHMNCVICDEDSVWAGAMPNPMTWQFGMYGTSFAVNGNSFSVLKIKTGRQFEYQLGRTGEEDVFFDYFDDLLDFLRKTYRCSNP